MAIQEVKTYLRSVGMEDRIQEFDASTATVEAAAAALGCAPELIAKTMSFFVGETPILIVTAGDSKIDNHKFKAYFHTKARMIPWDDVERYIGHAPGGVCPFAVKPGVEIYLDDSLKRFEYVYPAAGSAHSAVKLTPAELGEIAGEKAWIDVCKTQEQTAQV